MLNKLIAIRNVGSFVKLEPKVHGWNGVFAQTNIVYAPNGSGKTTLSMIFQSLKNEPELLKKKMTFNNLLCKDNPDQFVSFMIDNELVKYEGGAWSKPLAHLEVFNIHFIEDNLFAGSRQSNLNRHNLFYVLSGAEGEVKKAELASLRAQRAELGREARNIKNRARKQLIDAKTKVAAIERINALREPINKTITVKDQEIGLYVQEVFAKFSEKTNIYLGKFSESLRLEKISKELDQRTTFYLQFGSNRVTFKPTSSHEFRYTLSEGDKNALAISVFLAKLSFIQNLKDWIVIFDDPLSSLDSGRRHLTVKELIKVSEMAGQLIVLTHDATFAADLEREARGDTLSLELIANSHGSQFAPRNHQHQNITGLFRDINTLVQFRDKGAKSDSERRDVVRCLRPVLEGLVRVKYFDKLLPNQWLGDFISEIRNATPADELHCLKNSLIFEQLCEINDYSKSLHHSSPGVPDRPIDERELNVMVNTTLALIKSL